MEKFKGFVVAKKGQFYMYGGKLTDDLDMAKEFNSKGSAKAVARKIGGEVKELAYPVRERR